jgi:site-specific DNA recombinase
MAEAARVRYLREADVLGGVDEWLLGVFDPKNIDAAVQAIAAAQERDAGTAARAEAARKRLAECDKRLANLRKQIEGGDAPGVVLG